MFPMIILEGACSMNNQNITKNIRQLKYNNNSMKNLYIIVFILPLFFFGQVDYVIAYSPNGELKSEGNINKISGEKEGEWKFYYTNNQLKKTENYIEGELNGQYKSYYQNGKLKNEGNYKDNKKKGFWKFYYENGQVKTRENYKYGYLRGSQKSYYDNGELKSKGNIIGEGILDGIWEFYYYTGQLREQHVYTSQILVSKKCFNKIGVRIKCP